MRSLTEHEIWLKWICNTNRGNTPVSLFYRSLWLSLEGPTEAKAWHLSNAIGWASRP